MMTLTDKGLMALSRMWFTLDVGVGRLAGNTCPNCGARPRETDRAYKGRFGVFSVWKCRDCALMYRPVGLSSDGFMNAYYTYIYANADLATKTDAAADPAVIAAAMQNEGKHRVALVEKELRGAKPTDTLVCFVGCSWGYELLPFRERGYKVMGIELGARRREHGKQALGLDIVESPAEAARTGHKPDVVISSHVLEHIPRLTHFLEELRTELQPPLQIHITPYVEDFAQDPALKSIIGREHPLGVVAGFWERYAKTHGLDLESRVEGYAPRANCGELVAVLRKR